MVQSSAPPGARLNHGSPPKSSPTVSPAAPGRRPAGLGHHVELDQAPLLLLLQVGPALLDVDVVPRQQFADRSLAVDVEREVDPEVGDRVPPDVGPEALLPGVQ